jgi:hypothetical protein
VLTDPPDAFFRFRDQSAQDITGGEVLHLSDLTKVSAGTYQGAIASTGLLPTDMTKSDNAYYLMVRVLGDDGRTLAEGDHDDIVFNNVPAIAPANFHIEKIQTSTPPADETYDLKFTWDASPSATKYVLYRSRNKFAQLYDDPCSIADIRAHHRTGDPDGVAPFCETTIDQDVGTDDTTQWVEMAEISAPTTSHTIPWSVLKDDPTDTTYFYLVRAENSTSESGYSTMVVVLKKHFVTNLDVGSSSINWLALPALDGGYTSLAGDNVVLSKASDVVLEIEGALVGKAGADRNQKIGRVAIWSPGEQRAADVFSYNKARHQWTGTNFDIHPGDSIFVESTPDTGFDWTVVGQERTLEFLSSPNDENTSINWFAIPYASKYVMASDVILDIEGALVGTAGAEKNIYIDRIGVWSVGGQRQEAYLAYNAPRHKWQGTDFAVQPGDGIAISLSAGGLSLDWLPPLIVYPSMS